MRSGFFSGSEAELMILFDPRMDTDEIKIKYL